MPLNFLGAGNWKATLWEDAPDADQNAGHLVRNEKTVRSTDTLQLKLAPSGGTVAIFCRKIEKIYPASNAVTDVLRLAKEMKATKGKIFNCAI